MNIVEQRRIEFQAKIIESCFRYEGTPLLLKSFEDIEEDELDFYRTYFYVIRKNLKKLFESKLKWYRFKLEFLKAWYGETSLKKSGASDEYLEVYFLAVSCIKMIDLGAKKLGYTKQELFFKVKPCIYID